MVAVPIKSHHLPKQVGAAAMVDNTAVGRLVVFRFLGASEDQHFISAFSFTLHYHGMTVLLHRTSLSKGYI